MARKNGVTYACQTCGQSFSKWQGQCSACGEWNTIVAEAAGPAGRPGMHDFKSGAANLALCQALDDVKAESAARFPTGFDTFDELIGGGLVPGGITLIGGEPGVGKSTFMLQLASRLAVKIKPILYISGEESSTQIKLRADRLNIGNGKDIFLVSEQNLDAALGAVMTYQPKLLVIDSIQTVFTPQLEATPGAVAQVRECAAILTKFGKDRGLPVMIIGHVTKEGAIAGPKVLEHIVDTVLYFEGEINSNFRILRVFKNRFGATGEVSVFQMRASGLMPVINPSDLFVSRHRTAAPGVVVVPLLEGSRCILAELQALVTHSFLSMPRRVVSGLDSNRIHLVLAVLEKHGGLKFYNRDVFANVAGGLRMNEPGGDLGLAMAMIGSAWDRPVPHDLLMAGELTLSGDIRPVAGIERRLAEGRRFGFTRFLVSAAGEPPKGNDVVRVQNIADAIRHVFPGGRPPASEARQPSGE
ncbi:MAG TPA: DNA repair protein RadA [Candidatus Ozemobacteraceae bacterium]|nr:DNA repair protein RadA [Candidatus Ozemobacteraceae bacterium]